MPRAIRVTYGEGGYLPDLPDGNIVDRQEFFLLTADDDLAEAEASGLIIVTDPADLPSSGEVAAERAFELANPGSGRSWWRPWTWLRR